eukprot:CAMPEP_0181221768 /NCGR_PEP_ID=MMETSP1096-20121128/29592_1 /TAXON_ID=156174 ORGANISM="Chrysochromulina ericina, Strain CCMP281" /NCGR_SAMPLE_ID=MMETSP1096 /ASSEMBLY_ACC=CAM_ASM_000453 /LENGTH=95 /DNA_ID=CAMNT_0023314451 /DNA_START=125 /DNA_END=412 /DNA_ORIENTATION=+
MHCGRLLDEKRQPSPPQPNSLSEQTITVAPSLCAESFIASPPAPPSPPAPAPALAPAPAPASAPAPAPAPVAAAPALSHRSRGPAFGSRAVAPAP